MYILIPFLNDIDTFDPEKILQKAKLCIEQEQKLQQLNMLESNPIAGRMNAS